jgi:hypothetical protein
MFSKIKVRCEQYLQMERGYFLVGRLGTLAETRFAVVETLSNHQKRAITTPPIKLKYCEGNRR